MGVILRAILYMIAVAIGLSLIRNLIAIIARWFGAARPPANRRPEVQAGGTLRKCATCGTYTPETTSIRSGDLWYCSQACLKQIR